MAKIEFKGMSKYLKQLHDVAWATEDVCKAALYAGADVVANEIRVGIEGLKTTTDRNALNAYRNGQATYISESQKQGLLESFGVAPMRNEYGVYDTKLGFDGYNSIKTKRYPNGQPNAMIARSCNAGGSSMWPQPFMDRAIRRSRKKAISAMDEAANKKIEKILGGK